tara:strand:+ start:8503 stop:8667 length:165 start_codon:yes stop_codon:yes gene_type:complete
MPCNCGKELFKKNLNQNVLAQRNKFIQKQKVEKKNLIFSNNYIRRPPARMKMCF